ncbi:MAG: copper transporter, partial [Acidimicrobiales bacterium]
MINFRFHIVSLTAVLLALGIGLVLGTTFLDDATVNQLESQLDGLENDLDRARERNDEQQRRLGAFEDEAEQLDAQLGERLYTGELQDDPVLVVSTRGIDEQWVDGVMTSLAQADADVVGAWWLTERLVLDDESEVGDLSAALELSTDDTDRLSRNLAVQLADVLYGAADVPDAPALTAPAEPALLARLREAGFVEYQLPEGAEGDVVRLPASGLRIVVVDGPEAALPAGAVVVPVLTDMTT